MEMKRRPISGFTLLELMVAVALVAILVAIGIPSYQSLRQEQMVRAATQAVYTDMMLLKSEAIKRNQNLSLFVFKSGENDWCYRIPIDAGKCNDCEDCPTLEGVKGADASEFPRIKLTENYNPGNSVSFSPRRGTSNAGNLELQSGDYRTKVMTSNIGRVSACALSDNLGGLELCDD